MLTILCDLDSTLADLHNPLIAIYNREFNDRLKIADLKTWNLMDHVKPECGRLIYDRFLRTPGLFNNMKPFPGAVERLKNLVDDGHDVYIATDVFFPEHATEKLRWCQEHVPFIPRDHIVLGAPKHMLRADVLIDDSPHQVRRYRQAWGFGPLILVLAFPYNECVDGMADLRAFDWLTPEQAWNQFLYRIRCFDDSYPRERRAPVLKTSSVTDTGGV